jgi:hypothetical protein
MLEVIPINTPVEIHGGVKGWVIGINLRGATGGHYLTYEVAWWDERTHRSEWFSAAEVSPTESYEATEIQFGFHP